MCEPFWVSSIFLDTGEPWMSNTSLLPLPCICVRKILEILALLSFKPEYPAELGVRVWQNAD